MDLSSYYEIVEEAIKQLGLKPEDARGEAAGQWNLKKGNASLWIDIVSPENQENVYFQIMCPISKIPENNREKFLSEVLEINHSMLSVAFSKYRDNIYLKTIRDAKSIDSQYVFNLIITSGDYANHYYGYFKEKYFGSSNTANV